MGRLFAAFGGLLGVLLIPLALSGPTAWLLLPAHALFTALATAGAAWEGWEGHPGRARVWGVLYVLTSFAMVAALELGSGVRTQGLLYWGVPWLAALAWGWVPPTTAGAAGWVGEVRRRRLSRRTVARRKAAKT